MLPDLRCSLGTAICAGVKLTQALSNNTNRATEFLPVDQAVHMGNPESSG
jgi:hypothetical protein